MAAWQSWAAAPRRRRNFGFLKKYKGFPAGAVESGGDITGELLETFGVGGTPLGQEVMTVSLEGRGGQPIGQLPRWQT